MIELLCTERLLHLFQSISSCFFYRKESFDRLLWLYLILVLCLWYLSIYLSCRAANTDFSDHLSWFVPIIHHIRQVFQVWFGLFKTIQFRVSTVSMSKIVQFKTIQFSKSTQFKCKYSLIVKNISISSYSV